MTGNNHAPTGPIFRVPLPSDKPGSDVQEPPRRAMCPPLDGSPAGVRPKNGVAATLMQQPTSPGNRPEKPRLQPFRRSPADCFQLHPTPPVSRVRGPQNPHVLTGFSTKTVPVQDFSLDRIVARLEIWGKVSREKTGGQPEVPRGSLSLNRATATGSQMTTSDAVSNSRSRKLPLVLPAPFRKIPPPTAALPEQASSRRGPLFGWLFSRPPRPACRSPSPSSPTATPASQPCAVCRSTFLKVIMLPSWGHPVPVRVRF